MNSEREKMVSGANYRPGDAELVEMRARAQSLMQSYNATTVADGAVRKPLLAKLLRAIGRGSAIRAPFYVDYGVHITIGADVFLNYGCVLLDVCPIEIGDGTQIGPMTQILAADHPRDPGARAQGLECGAPVRIGSNVWIGGGALILPGVQVGDDAIIGAGSVVTRDVPSGSTYAGNPAKPLPRR
ncbi:sugar O-acetyltransferase [Meridianimarinicoccus roseus]|uniref:Nodulation protein L n=1 Tax=Meridianimarinicoccus roseus TaxID=2072018 RepID=A0A2V2LKU3_9RHOB|nr:sugar O-acetyltransferase [Meridianimarinicoccus roseus]PWR04184.1 sugar O-acetyltransferase [Meridianimarinicoccus roseus]